ncbi:hypothetical protein [Roseateles sp. BYS87W]|uniref:Transporter n=1 Tax=Pelomonas baiyunensis TaxID=3299026 RepID=A0ABW7H2Q3_9BURK
MPRLRDPLLMALTGWVAVAAQAGRPLQTEDAGVIEVRHCEVEGVRSRWQQAEGGLSQSSLQLGCGLVVGTEVAFQAIDPSEFALVGKTQLVAVGDAQLTLAWTLAHRHVAAGWRRSGAGLTLAWTAPLAPHWDLHANLGHQRDEMRRSGSTVWALAAEHHGLGEDGRWQPMAEVFGDDRGQPWVNAALRFAAVPQRAFLDGSLGQRLGAGRARLVTLGFKLAW